MPRPSRLRPAHSPTSISPDFHLWFLRLLVPLGGHREFIQRHGFSNDTLAETLGLRDWIDPTDKEFDARLIRSQLRELHTTGERRFRGAAIPGTSSCLRANIDRLSQLTGLTAVDCQILEFAALLHSDRLLDDACDMIGHLSSVKLFHVLSQLLDIPEPAVRIALRSQETLARSGLLSVDRSGTSTLRGKLELLSDKFADEITSSDADPISLLRDTVIKGSPADLELADYDHVRSSLNVLTPYLKHAIAVGRKGVNIFLYGAPGTGKSQLAKVLSRELDCELFEVAYEDEDGDPVAGERRLRAFRAGQSFLSQRKAIMVFDEVEDVFNDDNQFFGRKSIAQARKGWINRMLEENPIPTFWLSNSVQCLDPAFSRRFDIVFEIPVPSRKQRERIIGDACRDLIDAQGVARLAESQSLAPAVVARAVSVVRPIAAELGVACAARAVELLICNTLEAQGHKPIQKNDPNRLPDVYDPAYIHADADLPLIAAGLVKSKSGRLCLYGPPGTGKTAYGRWLAEQMGVPLVVKRASDLMSKWVGENEKNIARAFRQAEQDGALLLIDEIDSFLQDRRGAQRGWEVSLVNEMLTQMESFPGVFIASTNLMDGLDQAALRRFDLKVKFDYLQTGQARELFQRYCCNLGLPQPQPEQLLRLSGLHQLTPGDFAAVARQNRFRRLVSTESLVMALAAECALKDGSRATIGFV